MAGQRAGSGGGVATIDIIRGGDLVEKPAPDGALAAAKGLRELQAEYPVIGDVRGRA